jgi:3-deoxy-D-manno-octulosonate 8-phosphate phosphatase (KDO 8-P phosphatase)
MQSVLEKAKSIRMAVFDVDGVLTDGSLHIAANGEESKAFNSRDGHGMKMLKASGVELAIITSRESRCVDLRAQDLGITLVFQGTKNKLQIFEELLLSLGLEASVCVYVGDDLVDLPVMLRCGLAISVPAAPALVKKHADYVTHLEGGHGAVREVCEMIMSAQDTLYAQQMAYLK